MVTKSDNTPWYDGPSLLSHLEEVYIAGDRNLVDVRFPVQYVIRPQTHEHADHRSYAGTVASGVMRPGDEIVVLPAGKTSRITAIEGPSGPVQEAFPPMAVSVSLADDIDISRGDLIARPNNQPRVAQEFDATVCWMADEASLEPGRDYIIKHTTRTTRVKVTALDYRLDVNTLHRDKTATALKLNELGRISLRTQVPLLLDEYSRNAATGSFILIDPNTNGTVAAGMILPYVTARTASPNTVRHESLCNAEDRLSKGRTVWFTGLSGSGKSSVAMLVEQKLLEKGVPAYVLDGDNLRHGLNADLGFSMADRAENLRRLAHVATLLADSGQVVLVPAISPLEEHRELARRVATEAGLDFFEVFCDTPLEDCETTRPEGVVRQGARRRDHALHRHRQPLPAAEEPRSAARRRTTRPMNSPTWSSSCWKAGSDRPRRRRPAGDRRPASCCSTCAPSSPTPSAAERKAAGDKRSHDFLMEALAAERPGDAVLSEEGADNPVRLSAERVWIVDPLDGTREFSELGRDDWAVHVALWQSGELVAGAVALPAQGITLATPDVTPPPARAGQAADRGVAHPAAGGRAGRPRRVGRHAGRNGFGGRESRLRRAGPLRRLRARRRPVRMGLRGAGRGGPRRRTAHVAHRRLAAGLQPARPVAARPGGVPPGVRRRGARRHPLSRVAPLVPAGEGAPEPERTRQGEIARAELRLATTARRGASRRTPATALRPAGRVPRPDRCRDLGLAVLDQQPEPPIARTLVGKSEGDDDATGRQRRPIELHLAPGPQCKTGIGPVGGHLHPALTPRREPVEDAPRGRHRLR